MCFLTVELNGHQGYHCSMLPTKRMFLDLSRLMPLLGICSIALLALLGSTLGTTAATDLPSATVRLLDGGTSGENNLAGVEIAMGLSVKTYWRMPGDSGLPPVFDWSGSENLAEATVQWPLPERIADPSGTVLGYHDTVIFPIIIKAKDPAKAVRLVLKLDYGVCGDLCVPMTAKAELVLSTTRKNGPDAERVNTFLARVPRPSTVGQTDRPSLLSIESKSPDGLLVSTTLPLTDLIIEGPDGWYFGDATPQSALLWQVKILQKPATGKLAGLALTLTLIAKNDATEISLKLDESGSIR